ncbi:40-residue YVTN family beta-propeller repeat protein [Candidatus Sulfopaludibacter sp. SbA4]|nr:40-residue YVTN family beta-propeller repeat protein [Candidatus Sulfopaludibacter sp. SbA4]
MASLTPTPNPLFLLVALALTALAADRPTPPRFPSPIELAFSKDGARLFALCEGTDEVVAYDARSGSIVRRIPVGRVPKGLALSPDGKHLYVANSWSDSVSEIDTAALEAVRSLPAGFEPNSVVTDLAGRFLYVANRISNDVSVVDLVTGAEVKRLVAGRGAAYLALSPDGASIYCTHIYPNPGLHRTPPESEITVIDTARQVVKDRYRLPNAAGVFHVALSADGRLGMAAQLRPKNLVPLAHVEHGWVFGNSISVFGEDVGNAVGEVVQIPIDELDRYFTPPFAIVLAPDKTAAYISTTGSDSVTVIDIPKLLECIRSATPAERRTMANDLSASANYVVTRIPVGSAPKGMVLSPDGKRLYVANRTDDTISVIDTASRKVTATLSLEGPAAPTAERRGERLFFSARFAFQGHFGCANCHLESTFDGLQWDLEPDGFGKDIVDNRLLEDVAETAPFKWNGSNPNLETECGPRTEKFFYRSESYDGWQLADLVAYIKAMPLRPNRYRLASGELTPAQERGKAIFERTRTRSGAPIPESNQCAVCHSGRHYTNQQLADVGSGKPTDRSPLIDVPQLTNVFLTAPYLHDGSARTLEEIWTVFNPKDTHGVTNDLQKDELNDLIEYLKTL